MPAAGESPPRVKDFLGSATVAVRRAVYIIKGSRAISKMQTSKGSLTTPRRGGVWGVLLGLSFCKYTHSLLLSSTPCTTDFSSASACESALVSEFGTTSFSFNGVSHSYDFVDGYDVNDDSCPSGSTYSCYSYFDDSYSFNDILLWGCDSGLKNFYICDETGAPTTPPTASPTPAAVVTGDVSLQVGSCTTNFASAYDCETALYSAYSDLGFTYNSVSHFYETEGVGYDVNTDSCTTGSVYVCYSVYDPMTSDNEIYWGCEPGPKNFLICSTITAAPTSPPSASPTPATVVTGGVSLQARACTSNF